MPNEQIVWLDNPSVKPRPILALSRPLHVALVNMPWAWVDAPSIQCGLLQSVVREAGHHCDVHYLNVELAAVLGPQTYDRVSQMNDDRFHQLGEWLFSYSAFGDIRPEEEYFAEYPEVSAVWSEYLSDGPARLTEFRRKVLPTWLETCLQAVDWASYDAVGFTSTFLQNTASLAFGRMLKNRFPDIATIYGGANFDGTMGPAYAEAFGWLDYVVCGEGDVALPALLQELAAGTRNPVPGVYGQATPDGGTGESTRTRDLDQLPVPDYHDYFAYLDRHAESKVFTVSGLRLPVEFSRGCWWGEKHHCTFCGLNALGINYRAKTSDRALHELDSLLRDYPIELVYAVDNILDMKYLTAFCSELAERHWDINMFFEVKANLSRDQLRLLKWAGIRRIQPGVESLSTHVLGLMRKGATKLINVRLLKWARYYGIATEWHMLNGFPGECDEDYLEQAKLVPLLYHLQPPQSQISIWLERFSPYFMETSFPITDVHPQASYGFVYPPSLDYSKIAYFFDYKASDLASSSSIGALGAAVDGWRSMWATGTLPNLFYQRLPGSVRIIDSRTGPPRRAVLEGWHGDAYAACAETAHTAKRIHQDLTDEVLRCGLADVTSFLDECCQAGLMISEDGKYLALALPENESW